MKKRLILLEICLAVLMLSSCSAKGSDGKNLSNALANTGEADFRANITAVFPEREAPFTLDYKYLRDGDDKAVVVAPDEISGIAFTVADDGVTLNFEETNLEMGSLGAVSPLTAIPSLVSVWVQDLPTETEKARMFDCDCILAVYHKSAEASSLEYRTWFSKETSLPLYAEIFSDGERIIQCKFEKVVTK